MPTQDKAHKGGGEPESPRLKPDKPNASQTSARPDALAQEAPGQPAERGPRTYNVPQETVEEQLDRLICAAHDVLKDLPDGLRELAATVAEIEALR